MAERRMFAKSIVLSDAFLDMPLSARCLYFTLGMLADDDGFVGSPKGIMRQCGASQDDMVVLLQKRFILAFESGVIVIKHWRMNNYLQSDRHKKTTYIDELETLEIDNKGAYTERKESMYTKCIQNVYTGKDSIGKDSIDKDIYGAEAPVRSKKTVKVYSEDNSLNEAIKDFIAHRKALKKPMTDKAVDLFLKKLDKMADTSDLKIALINNAIEHGWLSVYPLKDEEKKETGTLVFDIDGFDQSPPFYGMPKEWFENGELVRERIRPVLQKRNDALYISDDILYSEEEVYKKYLRRKEASNAG